MELPIKSDFIKRLRRKNISPTWGFLLLGLHGPGNLPRLLERQEIIDYALEKYLNGCQNELVEKLAFARKDESDLVDNLLFDLKETENTPHQNLKIWELLLLEDLLSQLPENPVSALCELTSFWNQFNFPKDSPHQVQGRFNLQTPEEYYTQKNYLFLLDQHKKWLSKTEQELKER